MNSRNESKDQDSADPVQQISLCYTRTTYIKVNMDGTFRIYVYIYVLKDPLHGIVLFLFRIDTVTLFTVNLCAKAYDFSHFVYF